MKELTFREVIANIKEGEVWETVDQGLNVKSVTVINGQLKIRCGESINTVAITLDRKLKLQRKEYTFEEAFKAYEEGKEIESIDYKYKKINGKDRFYTYGGYWREDEGGLSIDFNEIRNKWYIND